MKFVAEENGRNPEKTYLDSVSSTTKPTWSDRDANSGSQRNVGMRASNRLRHGAVLLNFIEFHTKNNSDQYKNVLKYNIVL